MASRMSSRFLLLVALANLCLLTSSFYTTNNDIGRFLANYANAAQPANGARCSCDDTSFLCVCFIPTGQPGGNNVTTFATIAAPVMEHFAVGQPQPIPTTTTTTTTPAPPTIPTVPTVPTIPPAPNMRFKRQADSVLSMTDFHPDMGNISITEEPIMALQLIPDHPRLLSTTFRLMRRDSDPVRLNVLSDLTDVSTMHKLFVIIPGYGAVTGDEDYQKLSDNLMTAYPSHRVGVLMVDWNLGGPWRACSPNAATTFCIYGKQAVSTIVRGRHLAVILNILVRGNRIRAEDVHMIGYDLGAHIGRVAGNWFTRITRAPNIGFFRHVGRLTALDPSQLYFSNAVDFRGSALYTDVIHTSAFLGSPIFPGPQANFTDVLRGNVGMTRPVGNIDFYPNNGRAQTSCDSTVPSLCDHASALSYFTLSLDQRAPASAFDSLPCSSLERLDICRSVTSGPGRFTTISSMGIRAEEYCGRGRHYLRFDENAINLQILNARRAPRVVGRRSVASNTKANEQSNLESMRQKKAASPSNYDYYDDYDHWYPNNEGAPQTFRQQQPDQSIDYRINPPDCGSFATPAPGRRKRASDMDADFEDDKATVFLVPDDSISQGDDDGESPVIISDDGESPVIISDDGESPVIISDDGVEIDDYYDGEVELEAIDDGPGPAYAQPHAPEFPDYYHEYTDDAQPEEEQNPSRLMQPPPGLGQFPWHVAITENGGQDFVCSGVIINPNWVLTAASCFANRPMNWPYRLVFGVPNYRQAPSSNARDFSNIPGTVYLHGDFKYCNFVSNIALVKIVQPLYSATNRQANGICVPTLIPTDFDYGNPRNLVTVVGWSDRRGQIGAQSSAVGNVVPSFQCNRIVYDYRLEWCANTTMSCEGEAGSPIQTVADGPDQPTRGRRAFLRGIVSRIPDVSPTCGSEQFPSVLLRMDRLAGWIDDTLKFARSEGGSNGFI